jgi:hypothetical protein
MTAHSGTREPKLLAIQAATRFELTESGRLRHEKSPDRSPAPRLWIGGSAVGNAVRIHVDVSDETARAIETLAAREPPLREADSVPVHLDDYVELLAAEAPVEDVERGITYTFPDPLRYEYDAHVVGSHTREGAELFARLDAEGMPEDLFEMGFVDTTHLWPPWSVALEDGTIVSVAFTARLSEAGAEVGVATPPSFRGRGFAAATTAAWASSPALAGRVLLYSTEVENVSSLRVVDRLGLPFVGPDLSIT